jgi:hypothetical protein
MSDLDTMDLICLRAACRALRLEVDHLDSQARVAHEMWREAKAECERLKKSQPTGKER